MFIFLLPLSSRSSVLRVVVSDSALPVAGVIGVGIGDGEATDVVPHTVAQSGGVIVGVGIIHGIGVHLITLF